ncbi:MAG: fibronectin type III domain-containing protein, partial [Chloroflexota bacterium]|nr:fibronectin type III domain-containing protein [Chloroflexota bacterium]MDE2909733.1 fibronectin type III domain-containing protein [Chloroflexota bacterium]
TNVSAGSITNDSITLTWTRSSGATSYEVRYNPTIVDFTNWSDIGDVDSYTLTGLTAARAYALQVRAKNAIGVSSHVTARATTLDGPNKAPPDVTNLRVTRVTHNSITASWTKSPGATSYEGPRRIDSNVWYNYGNVDSHTFTGLLPDTFYEVRQGFRARNAYGISQGLLLQISATTLPAPPGYYDTDDDDDEEEDDRPRPTPAPSPTPIRDTLNHLPAGIQVSNWQDGAQGKRVGPAGVGRADVIEQGILDAVDVWSNVTPGVEVCFNQLGRVVFLDAAYAPRKLSDLPAYSRAGMTCTIIDSAGTVVLLRGESPPPQSSQSQSASAAPLATAEPSKPHSQTLRGCEVRPWANVKFRQSPPGGEVIGVTAIRKWLPASEKRYGYFKVRLWGREGWISGRFVYTRGDCGA